MDPNEQSQTTAETQGIEITTDDLGADANGEEGPEEIDLQSLKEATLYAQIAIRKQQEPIYQLEIVRDAINHATKTDRMGRDPEFAKYLNDSLGMKIMPTLSRERSLDNQYLNVCADIHEAWTNLFMHQARMNRFSDNFTCALTWCFQPNCNLHNLHFEFSRDELKQIAMSHQTWRQEIQIGGQLDVQVKTDTKITGWMLGTVTKIIGDIIEIKFTDSSVEYDKTVDRWSTNIAPAGQKTAEDYEWRNTELRGCVDYEVDAHDGNDWFKATILQTKMEQQLDGREIELAYVALRVYRANPHGKKMKEDERGTYEGYSNKYDEWMPLFSPNIRPFGTMVGGAAQPTNQKNDDDELDKFIKPSNGFERVYAVPRIATCLSKKFLYLMDSFGNKGGFDQLLDILENREIDGKNGLTLTSLGYLITLISMPAKLWHRDFVNQYGIRFCKAIENRFLESKDDLIRDVDNNCTYQAIIATNYIKERLMTRTEARKEMEVFKLKFIKKCLESQFLEKRIQGIKDLNEIVNDTIIKNEPQMTQEMIDWILNNQVFSLIWDPKKTHIQLVQRSGDIFRCFLKESLLTTELLAMFWNLTKSDYKLEIFKILDDCEYYLEQEQIEYIFGQITQTPAVKLGIEEFDILSMLGRRCKLANFSNQISFYFWRIIKDSAEYNQELLDCCVTKFAEMIKYWSITLKKPFFEQLAEFMSNSSAPTIPVLRLFQKIVADHKDREIVSARAAAQNTQNPRNYGNVQKWVSNVSIEPVECRQVFDEIEESSGFSNSIVRNLVAYFESVQGKTIDAKVPRKQLKLENAKYLHCEEVDERLKFLQTFAANSSFEVAKQHLKVVYDLLSNSPVKSDLEEFLKWCKSACENPTDRIVDLNEVGEFFSEQIAQRILDLKSMPQTGFHFIRMFFVSANIGANQILRQQKPKKNKKKKESAWGNLYTFWEESDKEEEKAEEDIDDKDKPYFLVMENPSQLLHLDMIWSIVLESEVTDVYTNAINLLVYSYLSVDQEHTSEQQRSEYVQQLFNKVFELVKPEANPSAHIVSRVTDIIKETIRQSEQSGTVEVRPHRSILKGELLDRILIKYMSQKNVWGEEKVERAIVLKLYTSCTLWELKNEISKLLGLAPKYLELEFPGKKILNDCDHGIDMQSLGLRKNDQIKARKVQINENIPQAKLVDEQTQWLVPRAERIFTEWFNMFKNPAKEKMDNFGVARFITKTTKTNCLSSDPKVQELIQQYNQSNDGMLSLNEFLQIYYDAASEPGEKRQACFKNLKNMNVRADLLKLSEVTEKALFSAKHMMPRFSLQANESQYQTLWHLLERNDGTCSGTWELVRMLATNQKQYMEVIRMSNVTDDDGQVDWNAFFQGSNVYKKIYLQEIILSVLEDSESSGQDVKRVMFVEEQKISAAGYSVGVNAAATKITEENQAAESAAADQNELDEEEQKRAAEITELRLNWSRNFLERGGFQFVLSQMYSLDVETSDRRQIEFMMTLVRVFLIAAFATDSNKDIGKAVKLARKSSSIDGQEELDKAAKKVEKRDKLLELLHGELGMEILLSTNYARLQQKILTLVFKILLQSEISLEDKIIVENAISVWVGICLYRSESFDEFLSFKSGEEQTAEDFILSGLIFCPEEKIRQDFNQGIQALAKSFDIDKRQKVLSFLLGILGKNFIRVPEQTCSQYFDLFISLIDLSVMHGSLRGEQTGDQESNATYEPATLLAQLIDKIIASQKQQKALKSIGSQGEGDQAAADEAAQAIIAANKERLLVGLITLTRKIIQTADKEVSDKIILEKNLIDLIFKQFLFVSYFQQLEEEKSGEGQAQEIELVQRKGSMKSGTAKAVVSNSRSREAAFSLLNELVKQSDALMQNFIKNVLMPMLDSVEKPKKWNYTPPSKEGVEGRVQEYVGLRNLGCICYMNSMMQQFFMIPALRYNLLCVEDGKEPELVEYKGRVCDDNMFHQMQRLFTNLELSERMDYNPFGFCFAFKEFDGQPTNTTEQKDAQEFLNLLFDRLETALKPTSRKYLLEGIFGGKQCSQMVCTECGKVKNRHEDFLNLSLNIKDIKSVYQSLQKLVEGEIISDYQCDGCNRKVDLSKRTLIAETPNVLIVHLQRIGFNFETFETDKVNTLCKFPTLLDLKPYSYFEVMGKEDRLKKVEDESDQDKTKQKQEDEMLTEEELQKKKEAEEETREPVREDCFEYKLVGVNVHSGTANMGHYWSYINTNRGHDEKEGDTNWIRTDLDPWMEFNDSRVSDWDFKELEKQCFGNEVGAGFMGDSYGTSGYMLFYERRKKKDLKILIDEEKVEEEKAKGIEVHHDEEKKEYFKKVPYRQAAIGEKAIPLYRQVMQDNTSVNFENDIYSTEFFDFILKIMRGIAGLESSESKDMGLKIGKKVGFDILARCLDNTGLPLLTSAMIEILKSSDQACLDFMETMLDDDDAEPIMEILFDCPDKIARKNLIRIIRYLLCRLKDIEKDKIMANEFDVLTETFTTYSGETATRQILEPRSFALKFIKLLKSIMSTRAARSWKLIDTYMDIFFSFGVQSAEDVEAEFGSKQPWSRETQAYKTGMSEYLRSDFMALLGDFILQDSSPLFKSTDYRIQMGNYYIQPDFDKALLLITIMMSETELLVQYPLSDDAKRIGQSKAILQQLIKSSEATSYGSTPSVDFTEMLNLMCKDNFVNSKKMAKVYAQDLIQKTQIDEIQKGLKSIRGFLLIKDSIRQCRFEWIFGFGQVFVKRNQQRRTLEVGVTAAEFINSEAYQYKSGIVKHTGDALLTEIYKAQKIRSEFTIYALYELVCMCIEDEEICEYIYNQPPPTYQYVRYTDWFEAFCKEQRAYLIEQSQRYTTYQDMQARDNIQLLTQTLSILPTLKEKCAQLDQKWMQARQNAKPTDFDGYKSVNMVGSNEEVLDHYPPQFIVGQPVEEVECYVEEHELVTVRLFKMTCEYIYGNPTGKFNLSLPEKKLRSHLNFREREKNYAEWKKAQNSGQATEFRSDDQVNMDEQGDDDEVDEFEGLDVRQWHDHSLVGEVLLKIDVENTSGEQIKVEVGIQEAADSTQPLNCRLPKTNYFTQVYAKGLTVRPVMALIQKIDPSKPFGSFKITISAKRMRQNFSNVGRSYGAGADSTNKYYQEVVNQIGTGQYSSWRRGVGGVFVTSTGNDGGLTTGDGETTTDVTRRRNGLNLGDINVRGGDEDEDLQNNSVDGNMAEDEDGQRSFASDKCNNDNNLNNFGSDLEDDLNKEF